MREFIYWGWETKLGRSPLSPPFFRLMNGHEFHDRPPVSTLMMEMGGKEDKREREKGGPPLTPFSVLFTLSSLVRTRTLSFF